MPYSSARQRAMQQTASGRSAEPHGSKARKASAHGSLRGPVRRRFGPLITAASLVALTVGGVVHTVGLEPVGQAGGSVGGAMGSDDAAAGGALAESLRRSVMFQCADVGRRTSRYSPRQDVLEDFIRGAILGAGLRLVEQDYTVESVSGRNFIGVLPGPAPGAVLVGAHFDSLGRSPCANASASAVAALEGIAGELRGKALQRTVLFCFFDNGERPNHGKPKAGGSSVAGAICQRGGPHRVPA